MTCAMQKMNPSAMAQDWKAIFPDFTTLTGSRQFIKKLMAVSLSALTYMRGIFPEKAYGERHLCGLKLKLLTEDSGIESVNKFIDLIRSCYDAVDKRYLYQLSIGIGTDDKDRDTVVESYNMNFRFRDDEFVVENKSSSVKLTEKDPTVKATLWLLKSIFTVSEILDPLPKKAYLTMKLLYHDEITPQDYEPPGFEPSDSEKFMFPENAVKLEIGKVATDIHGYKMYLKTALSKENLRLMLEDTGLTDSQKSVIPPTNYDGPQETMLESNEDRRDSQNKYENVAGDETDCPCTCKQDSGTNIIMCASCGKKQHSICYGFLEVDEIDSEFLCTLCINEAPFRSSQEDLIYTYDGKERQELCALRRTLVFCANLKFLTTFQLERQLKCSKQLAKDLIERLEFEGFVKKTGLKHKFTVNGKKIRNNGYQEYFFRAENKENIENSQKTRRSKEKVADIADDDSDIKGSQNSGQNEDLQPQDQLMDFAIDKEVEKMNLEGTSENPPGRNLRRRTLLAVVGNDSDESVQRPPKKRRCMSTKEVLLLND